MNLDLNFFIQDCKMCLCFIFSCLSELPCLLIFATLLVVQIIFFYFPQREEVCIWFHLSVCSQSSIHSFQDIIFKFCVMIDTSDNLSGFNFDENRVKDQSVKPLYYPQFSMGCLHTSQQ